MKGLFDIMMQVSAVLAVLLFINFIVNTNQQVKAINRRRYEKRY